MSQLLEKIEHVWKTTEGWASYEKAMAMSSIVLAMRCKVIVEIGIWYGRSFLPAAISQQATVDGGVAFAIDSWKASESVAGQVSKADQDWWNREQIHEQAYDSFRSSVQSLNLKNVQIKRMSSAEVDLGKLAEGIGLLHIDGNHGKQVLEDVRKFAPMVKPGGFIIMDDLQWTGGSVRQAAGMLPEMGFVELYRILQGSDNWAAFQRIGK
jgi:cephalosporin hydroxylase